MIHKNPHKYYREKSHATKDKKYKNGEKNQKKKANRLRANNDVWS